MKLGCIVGPMKWSTSFAVLTSLLLTGCSADYPLKAVFTDGKLYFVGAKKDWFFGRTGFCPSYFSVREQSGKTVWRIETDLSPSECELFPVVYGVAPKGWKTVVRAALLKSGELYVLNGQGGDSYHGAFRYRERRVLSVENEPELARKFPDPPYDWQRHNQMAD
jgi:hypothetical protein